MEIGNENAACPYFATQSMQKSSEIVFCPYNYLLDVGIREHMGLALDNAVVIFDEAHNIEDVCNSLASFETDLQQIESAVSELRKIRDVAKANPGMEEELRTALECMHAPWDAFLSWIRQSISCGLKTTGFQHEIGVWHSDSMLLVLDTCGFNSSNFVQQISHLEKILEFNSQLVPVQGDKISANKIQGVWLDLSLSVTILLESFFKVLKYIFESSSKFAPDFKLILQKEISKVGDPNPRRQFDRQERVWTYTVSFICFNPAVAFEAIQKRSRSVILTSGTLSPMDSFASELATDFSIKLEAPHVIPPSQVLIGSVSSIENNGVKINTR